MPSVLSNHTDPNHVKKLVVAIDSGTQSTRCIVYEAATMIRRSSSSKYEHPLISPHDGWSEHKVIEIEKAVVASLKEALNRYDGSDYEIVGIGITNQRETIVAWDGNTGDLLCDTTICWNDGRTVDDVAKIKATWNQERQDYVQEKTGLKIASYYSATKMKWMIDNVSSVRQGMERGTLRFGTIDSYIIYRLTNQLCHVSDVSNASRTLLFDIKKMEFDQNLCDWFGVPISAMPTAKPSAGNFGKLPSDFKKDYTLCPIYQDLPSILQGIPITGVLGDQQASTVGHNLFEAGGTKLTFGSGGFLLMNCGRGKPSVLPKGCTLSPLFQLEGEKKAHYCVEGSIAYAGMGITWMAKNNLTTIPEVDQFVRATPSSEGVLFIPAFSGMLSPWWNEDIKGSITGISLVTERKHIVKAFIDSLAIQVCEILNEMSAVGQHPSELRLDGGLSQSDGFCQILSDFTGSTTYRPPDCEMTARGVGIMAVLGSAKDPSAAYDELLKRYTALDEVSANMFNTKFQPTTRPNELEYCEKTRKDWLRMYDTMAAHYAQPR